jgi:hypothetical protein
MSSGDLPRGTIVLAYRLYKIDRNDEVDGPPQVITCDDDDAALIEARNYVDRHAIEVWRDDKRIGLIPADD